MLHIGPAGVRYLAQKHADFPQPVTVVVIGGRHARVWLREEVEAWAAPRGYFGRAAALLAQADQEPPPAASERLSGPIRTVRARTRHYVRRGG